MNYSLMCFSDDENDEDDGNMWSDKPKPVTMSDDEWYLILVSFTSTVLKIK